MVLECHIYEMYVSETLIVDGFFILQITMKKFMVLFNYPPGMSKPLGCCEMTQYPEYAQ